MKEIKKKKKITNLYESKVSYEVFKKLVFDWHGTHVFASMGNVVNPAEELLKPSIWSLKLRKQTFYTVQWYSLKRTRDPIGIVNLSCWEEHCRIA